MMGKAYYLTTLGDWQRHAARFARSHYIVLAPSASAREELNVASPNDLAENPSATLKPAAAASRAATTSSPNDATRILVLVEADEGAHLALEDDPAFEALPHPLVQKPISQSAQEALAPHGVGPGATTFDAAEALARVHPLLRHRVF